MRNLFYLTLLFYSDGVHCDTVQRRYFTPPYSTSIALDHTELNFTTTVHYSALRYHYQTGQFGTKPCIHVTQRRPANTILCDALLRFTITLPCLDVPYNAITELYLARPFNATTQYTAMGCIAITRFNPRLHQTIPDDAIAKCYSTILLKYHTL